MSHGRVSTRRALFRAQASLLVLASVAGFAAPALAQDSVQVEEVIITAQKREQSLQDVPISVTAVSAERLEAQGVENLETLSSYTPGVQIGKGAISTPITIRGIGSGSNRGFEQSVGMYVDGIYMGRDRQFRAPFLDLDRVEVLRGPQGTLFGRNTIGGAISIVTADPRLNGEVEGSAALRWSPETGGLQTTGVVSLPLGDTLGVRLAVQYRTDDGYITNVTRDRDEPNVEEVAARATVVWQPTDAFTANLKVSLLESDVTGMNAVVTRFTKVTGTVTPPTALNNLVFANVGVVEPKFSLGDPYTTYRDNPGVAGWSSRDAQIDTVSRLGVLNLEYDFGNGLTLTSVTGYSTYETNDGLDLDFLPIRFIFRDENQDFEQTSEELRLTSNFDGPFDFTAGVYVEDQTLSQAGALLINSRLGFLPASVFAGGPTAAVYPLLPANVISRNSYFDQQTQTKAVFGEVIWRATDSITVTLGGRYSEEDKDFTKHVWFGADASPQGLYAAPASITQENVLLLYVKALDPSNNLVNVAASRSESGFDPSLKVQWDVSDDLMTYFTYSKGRKSGGFNGNDDQRLSNTASPWTALTPLGLSTRNPLYDPTTPGAGFEYEAESATAYELGVKSKLFDGRMVLNGAIFLTRYDDLQVNVFQGTSFVVANANGSEIQGVELDGQFRATSELTLSAGLSYLDFQFSDYDDAGCTVQQASATTAPCVQDLTGKANAFAPRWSGNFSVDWRHPIGDDMELRMVADANYRASHYLDYDLDPASRQGAQTRVNARVTVGTASGSWEFSVWGQNLTDETTYTSVNDIPLAPGGFVGFVQEPRTIGLEARARF